MPPKTLPFGRKKKAKAPQLKYRCPWCKHEENYPSLDHDCPICSECGEITHVNTDYIEEPDTTPESITPPAAEPETAEDITAEPDPVEDEAPKFRIQRKPRTESLPVKLTDDERLAYGKEMADLLAEAEQIDREIKQFKKFQDSKLAGVQSKLSERSIAISNGYEYRNVLCEQVMDYDKFDVYLVRLDTFETVTSRKMTNDERQMQLTAE